MNARLRQYWTLWHAALGLTRALSARLLLLGAILVTLISTGIAARSGSSGAWQSWALCTPAGFLLFAWTMAYLPGAFKLNSPANAQLVPVMRRRLIELSMLVWLAGIGMLAAGMFLTTNTPGPGLWLAAFLTLSVSAMTAGRSIVWLLYLPVVVALLANKHLPAWLLGAVQDVITSNLALLALLPLGALTVLAIFPRAGKRHWAMVENSARVSGADGISLVEGSTGNLLDDLLRRRTLARRAPGALLMMALGRSLAGTAEVSISGATLGIGTMIYLTGYGALPSMLEHALAHGAWSITSGVLVIFLFQAGMAPVWLARTTGEQALVRLAPAFPATPARFNDLLARALLRQALAIWGMASVASLLLALLAGVRGSALLAQAGICCMTLPALALPLRDHARDDAWHHTVVWAIALGLSFVGPVAGAFGVSLFGLPYWPVALATAATLGAVLLRHRLRVMRAAPFAFPAGRLA